MRNDTLPRNPLHEIERHYKYMKIRWNNNHTLYRTTCLYTFLGKVSVTFKANFKWPQLSVSAAIELNFKYLQVSSSVCQLSACRPRVGLGAARGRFGISLGLGYRF